MVLKLIRAIGIMYFTEKMSGNIYGKLSSDPAGYHIQDPDGNIIGVWFSSVNNNSVSIDQQSRTVELLFLMPESRGGGR